MRDSELRIRESGSVTNIPIITILTSQKTEKVQYFNLKKKTNFFLMAKKCPGRIWIRACHSLAYRIRFNKSGFRIQGSGSARKFNWSGTQLQGNRQLHSAIKRSSGLFHNCSLYALAPLIHNASIMMLQFFIFPDEDLCNTNICS